MFAFSIWQNEWKVLGGLIQIVKITNAPIYFVYIYNEQKEQKEQKDQNEQKKLEEDNVKKDETIADLHGMLVAAK